MAIAWKKSATYKGTTLTVDLERLEGNRGVIRACLQGGADDIDDLASAISFLDANAPDEFPGTNIPKRAFTVEGMNGKEIRAQVVYQFTEFNFSGGNNFTSLAKFNAGMITVPWVHTEYTPTFGTSFDANGRPTGVPYGTTEAAGATSFTLAADETVGTWGRRVPVFTVAVPFRLVSNPILSVSAKVETTNSDAVNFGGQSFAANTIRFDGMWVEWVDVNGALSYVGEYQFTLRRDGWVKQDVYPVDPVADTAVLIGTPDMYQRAAYGGGAFPI